MQVICFAGVFETPDLPAAISVRRIVDARSYLQKVAKRVFQIRVRHGSNISGLRTVCLVGYFASFFFRIAIVRPASGT